MALSYHHAVSSARRWDDTLMTCLAMQAFTWLGFR